MSANRGGSGRKYRSSASSSSSSLSISHEATAASSCERCRLVGVRLMRLGMCRDCVSVSHRVSCAQCGADVLLMRSASRDAIIELRCSTCIEFEYITHAYEHEHDSCQDCGGRPAFTRRLYHDDDYSHISAAELHDLATLCRDCRVEQLEHQRRVRRRQRLHKRSEMLRERSKQKRQRKLLSKPERSSTPSMDEIVQSISSSRMTFMGLGSDVYSECFSYLNCFHVWWNIWRVCRGLRHFLDSSFLIQQRRLRNAPRLELPPNTNDAVMFHVLSSIDTNSVVELLAPECRLLTTHGLRSLHMLTAVRFVDLSGCGFNVPLLQHLLPSWSSLTHLRLGNTDRPVVESDGLDVILRFCPKIILLDVSGWRLKEAPNAPVRQWPQGLVGIDIHACDARCADALIESGQLEYLDASYTQNLNLMSVYNSSRLKYLNLRGLVAGPVLDLVRMHCPMLKVLDVSSTNATSNALPPFPMHQGLRRHANLSYLYMSSCARIEARGGLTRVLEWFPSVELLDISLCMRLDDISLSELIEIRSHEGSLLGLRLRELSVAHLAISDATLLTLSRRLQGLYTIQIASNRPVPKQSMRARLHMKSDTSDHRPVLLPCNLDDEASDLPDHRRLLH